MHLEYVVTNEETGLVRTGRVDITGTVVLGREPESAIPLDGKGISRNHCVLESDQQGLWLTDLSNNGTSLNGKRLQRDARTRIRMNDTFSVPGFKVLIRAPGGLAELSDSRTAAFIPAPGGNPVMGFVQSFSKFEVITLIAGVSAVALAWLEINF